MSVTTKDLAKICNVSRTTIVRALNNQKGISEERRKMILDKANELGYRPDMLAKGLVQGKSMYIGVVVFDVRNRYFAQMLSAIENEAKSRDYLVNITLHEKNTKKEMELIQRLLDYRVDGLILSPVSKSESFVEFLRNLTTPHVVIGNKVAEDIPYVGIDEREAAYHATNKIASKGYELIVFVCPPLFDDEKENIYTHKQRKEGFLDAMGKLKQKEAKVIATWNYTEEAIDIMKTTKKKVAFFCSGDEYALEIMKAMRSSNYRAPEHYGIMGFDNIDTLDYMEPRLTTIDNSVELVGREAVRLLFDQFDGKMIDHKNLVPYRSVEGDTL